MRVLIVEDQHVLADTIAKGLVREGMAVDVAYDGDLGLDLAKTNPYDVVVLDRDLPVVHGDDVCRALAGGPSRILMLTAATSIDDRVAGLRLGADDYLPKPFAFAELVARIEALCRRPSRALAPILHCGELTIDPAKRSVLRGDAPIFLTRKEFGVLLALARVNGDVVSTEALLENVWDDAIDPFTNVVRVTVMTLRRKLGDPSPIETVSGVGYRLR